MQVNMEKEDDERLCNNCKRPVSSDNFATHSAFCNRHIFVCRICDEPIQISEKNQHVEEYHVSSACDLCELLLEKWMLPKHMESCPKRLIECEYCEAHCPFDKFSEHVEFCGSRTEKCLLCKEYIMLKDKAKHNERHVYERKFRSKSVDEEIKQNKVNEVISKGVSAERTVKVSEVKHKFRSEKERGGLDTDMRKRADESFTNKSRSNVRTEDQNLKVRIPEEPVASLPDKTNENSKHYTQCHICKESIRWIDMNTHVPSCASSAGKCSVCGEGVPSYKLKEHMNNHLQSKSQKPSLKVTQNDDCDSEMNRIRSVGSYTAKSRESEVNRIRSNENYATISTITDETVKCPYCSQLCSKDRILSHTRNCLMNAYECLLCNERVPEMCRIKHETSECRMIQERDEPNRSHFSRGSSQSFYECPLCAENVPEDDRDKHVSFQCKSLMNSGGTHGLYGMRDDESDVYQCPLCLENMLQKDKVKHETFECKILIENSGVQLYESCAEVPKKTCGCSESASYAQVTKKQCGCNCKGSQTSEICSTCKNRIPQNQRAEHNRSCHRKKFPCLHCDQMIDAACEEIHLRSCPALDENRSYKDLKTRVYHTRSSTFEHGGAIPKNANIKDMIRPRTAKCMYCQTTLNADIVKYHEEECVQRPIKCPDCFDPILMKELGIHSCKKKKGKGKNHKGNRQASEEKDTSSMTKFLSYIGLHDKRKEDKSGDVNRQYPYSGTPSHYPCPRYNQDEVRDNQNLYFPDDDNTLIPCEFCNKKLPASELVLHETGCQPALVSFAKPGSSEDTYQSKLSSRQKDNVDSRSQNVCKTDINSPFFTETNSFLPTTKFERIKDREADVKPGEFLKSYSKTSTEQHKFPKRNENAAVEKKTEPLSLQSVWNVKSTYDLNAEDDDSKQISDHSDGEMDVDQTEEPSYMDKRERRCLKEQKKQISDKLDNDNEMTEIFNFLKPNGNKNTEFDEERENEEKAVPKSLETEGALDSNFSDDDAQDKHQKDLDLSKKTTIDEKMYKGSSRFIDNTDKDQKEYVSSFRTQKDFKFGTHESRASSSEDNVHHTAVLEKSNEEPEKLCEEKSSTLIDSDMDEKEYVSSFTQRLSDFKFGAHKTISLSSEDNVQHNALLEKKNQKPENFCEQKPPSYIDSAKSEEKYVNDFRQRLLDSKFGTRKTGSLSSEDTVHHTAVLVNNNEEPENLCGQKPSIYIDSAKNEEEYVNNFRQRLLNFKFGAHKEKFLSSEDNVHRTTLLEETEKLCLQKPSRSVDDCKNEKEYLSNFRQYMSDFKFVTHETRSEDDVHLTEEKNGCHDKHAFNLEAVLQESNRNTISDKLENLYKPSSRDTDDANKNYKECVTNSRYKSDIKFGANKACEDNVHHTYLPDEKRAFKIEPAQELLKDARVPICTISTKQAKKLEDLDEKIAKLHKRNLAAAGEKDDVTKWKKWREAKQSYSSGSE